MREKKGWKKKINIEKVVKLIHVIKERKQRKPRRQEHQYIRPLYELSKKPA